MIARNESEYVPLFLDSSHYDVMSTLGYEYITETLPLVVSSEDPTCQVINGFESNDVLSLLRTMRHQRNDQSSGAGENRSPDAGNDAPPGAG